MIEKVEVTENKGKKPRMKLTHRYLAPCGLKYKLHQSVSLPPRTGPGAL